MKYQISFKDNKNTLLKTFRIIIFLFILLIGQNNNALAQNSKITFKVINTLESHNPSKWHYAIYTSNNTLRAKNFLSIDNGKSWENRPFNNPYWKINENSKRGHVTAIYLPKHNRIIHFINTIELKGIGKVKKAEHIEGFNNYYLRYYLSDVNSKNYLKDKIIFDRSQNRLKPFSEINLGINSYFLGDIGSKPIAISDNKIILPIQQTLLSKNNQLFNPLSTTSFTGVRTLIGTFINDNTIHWESSNILTIDYSRSTRGLIEPTIGKLIGGKLMMIMRGSNEKQGNIRGFKWYSISNDNGYNWGTVNHLKFDDDTEFLSPSSMSLLINHSSGKLLWISNQTLSNPKGNGPRNRLILAEINQKTYRIIKDSMLVLEDRKGSFDISHVSAIENKMTKNLIITYPIYNNGYKNNYWIEKSVLIK